MSKLDFTGRVAIVTGAGGALGRAYCRLLAARGCAIVANDLGGSTTGEGTSHGFADAIIEEVKAAGGRAIANYDTVATPEGGEAIVKAALDTFGRIDIVINNAGNQRNGRFEDLTEADIDAVFAVHLKGAFFVTQPAYRAMVKQGYGRIVMTSSQSGIFGNPIRSNYGAAKTALIGLMNVIAQEAPPGVLVNAIFPNAAGGRLGGKPGDDRPDRDFLKAAGERSRHYIEGMDPDFVASMVAYLASERCTTSQNMYSVLGGKYSRLFVGATRGWYTPGAKPPSPDDIVAHLAEIDDRSDYDIPLSGIDEMDTTVAAVRRLAAGKVDMADSVTCALDIKAESGETPVWSAEEQKLYWVDQEKPTLNRFDPATGINEAWPMPAHCSSFALRGKGKPILVALRTGLHDFDPNTGTLTLRAAPTYDVATMRFNDGRCDRQGRYIIGGVDLAFFENRKAGQTKLWRFDDAGLAPILDGVTCSNGVAFSPDGRTMYRAESPASTIFAYDYDARAGAVSNERVFAQLAPGEGIPDGAEVDSEGGYWVALLMANVIARYRSDGTLDRHIPVPVLQPTKPCFGGPDLGTLYLTTASHRHIPGDTPMGEQAGGVFAIETGHTGIAEPMLVAA